jgi:protein TonB
VFRNYVIGSVIFHILFLAGAGACLPCFSHVKPAERYLQIYMEPDFAAPAPSPAVNRESTVLPAVKSTAPSVPAKPPLQPVAPRPLAAPEPKRANSPAAMDQTIAAEPVEQAMVSVKVETEPNIAAKAPGEVFALPKKETLLTVNPGVAVGLVVSKGSGQPAHISAESGRASPGPDRGTKDDTNLPAPDVRAFLVYAPQKEYPAQAKQHNWEGKVWVKALVGSDGKVKQATVFVSSGHPVLDESAVECAKKRYYQPAQKDGNPVACFVKIPFTFKLEE